VVLPVAESDADKALYASLAEQFKSFAPRAGLGA